VFTSLRRTLALLVLPTALVVLAAPASAATALPQPVTGDSISAPSAAPQGIIMRDGGICNPRWGC
jgi:hypothetical protein